MAGWVERGARAVEALWPMLLDHLWQATLFTILVLLLTFALRGIPARLRHHLFLFAALKFLLPSALLALLALRFREDLARFAEGLNGSAGGFFERLWAPAAASDLAGSAAVGAVALALSGLWLAGTVALLSAWGRSHLRIARQVRSAPPLRDPRTLAALELARARLGLKGSVTTAISSSFPVPGVWGVLRPVLVLPTGMEARLSEAELETLVLHELIHVRRRDNLIAALQRALCCLIWFHPLVWLLDRRLLAEREEACDEQVVRLSGGPEVYRRTLLKVLSFGLGRELAGASALTASNLKRRLDRLSRLSKAVARPPGRLAEPGFLALATALFFFFSIASATTPTGGSTAGRAEPAAESRTDAPPICIQVRIEIRELLRPDF